MLRFTIVDQDGSGKEGTKLTGTLHFMELTFAGLIEKEELEVLLSILGMASTSSEKMTRRQVERPFFGLCPQKNTGPSFHL